MAIPPVGGPGSAQPLVPWPSPAALPEGVAELLDNLHVGMVSAVLWQCTARWGIPPRVVPDEMFFLIRRGTGWIEIAGRRLVLRPGVCAHMRRGVRHSAGTDPGDPIEVIAIHYQALVGGITVAHLLDLPDAFQVPKESRVAELFESVCRESAVRQAGWRIRSDGIVAEVLVSLIRDGNGAWLKPPPALAEARRLLPALAAMRDRLAEAPGLTSLARLCGVSPAQFRRVFHRAFACSPMEHLHRLRVAEAARLLRSEGLPVAEVAHRVGYQDQAWFSHTFLRLTGRRPGAYARSSDP